MPKDRDPKTKQDVEKTPTSGKDHPEESYGLAHKEFDKDDAEKQGHKNLPGANEDGRKPDQERQRKDK